MKPLSERIRDEFLHGPMSGPECAAIMGEESGQVCAYVAALVRSGVLETTGGTVPCPARPAQRSPIYRITARGRNTRFQTRQKEAAGCPTA